MKPECRKVVETAAGRRLTDAEVAGIDERIYSSMRDMAKSDPAKYNSMSRQEIHVEAAKLAKERMLRDVVEGHERTIQEAARKARLFASVDSAAPRIKGGKTSHLTNMLARLEVEGVNGIVANFIRTLKGLHDADSGKLFGLLQDKSRERDVAAAMFGESSTPEAAKAAASIRDMQERVAARFKSAGGQLHAREDWRAPQVHDPIKVSADMDAWAADHMSWVDRNAYIKPDGRRMTEDELHSFLREVAQTKGTDGANKRAVGDGGHAGGGLTGGARNAPRQIHYKDSASYMASMAKYGASSSIYEAMNSHLRGMSRDIALMEAFGRNSDVNFKQAIDRARNGDQAAVKGEKDASRLAAASAKLARFYDAYAHPQRPESAGWANAWTQVRGVLASTQLGSLVGALPDLAAMKMMAELHGMPQMQLFGNMAKALAAGKDGKQLLHDMGVWFEGFEHINHRMAEDNFKRGYGTFLNGVTHVAMGLNAFDRGMRAGTGMTTLNILGRFSRLHEKLADAEGKSPMLKDRGVTQDHWDVWREAALDDGPLGNRTVLSAKSIYDIPDEKIDGIAERRVAARSEILKAEIERRDARTAQENGWVQGRIAKLAGLRDRANKWLREFDERGQARIDKAADGFDSSSALALHKLEAAEIEAEIAKEAAKTRNMAQVKNLFDEVQVGSERYANQRGAQGEALGARRRMLEEDIADHANATRKIERAFDAKDAEHQGAIKALDKTLDEYLAKWRKYIDATTQKIKDGKFSEEDAKTMQNYVDRAKARVDKKPAAIEALKSKVEELRAKAKNDAEGKVGSVIGGHWWEITQLEKKISLAENQHDVIAYLAAEKNRVKLQRAADDVQWIGKRTADRTYSIGQVLGERRARVEARIKELDARVAARQKTHDTAVATKASAIDKRMKGLVAELQSFRDEVQNRNAQRAEYAGGFQKAAGNVLEEERAKLRDESAEKLLGIAHGQMQFGARGASPMTTQDRMMLGLDSTTGGTIAGELLRFIMQFKSVPLGIFRQHWAQVQRMDTVGSKLSYGARFVAYSALMGALSMQLKAAINGQNPRDMNPENKDAWKNWLEAVASGGSLGAYGDLLLNSHTASGAGVETLAGPGVAAIWDLVQQANRVREENIDGQVKHPTTLFALRWLRRNATPMANLWYLKAGFNRMIYDNLQDTLSPGSSTRQRERMEQRGASYFWAPGPNSEVQPYDPSKVWR